MITSDSSTHLQVGFILQIPWGDVQQDAIISFVITCRFLCRFFCRSSCQTESNPTMISASQIVEKCKSRENRLSHVHLSFQKVSSKGPFIFHFPPFNKLIDFSIVVETDCLTQYSSDHQYDQSQRLTYLVVQLMPKPQHLFFMRRLIILSLRGMELLVRVVCLRTILILL
jgi:hypothetical protein